MTFHADCTTTPSNDRVTSYNYSTGGTGRLLDSEEITTLQKWLEGTLPEAPGQHGIVTTSSYYGWAAESANVNAILGKYGIRYAASDQAGHIISVLNGEWDSTHDGGADIGSIYNSDRNVFNNSVEPLFHQEISSGYSKKVIGLQVRSGVPIVSTSGYSPGNAPGSHMPASCFMTAKKTCPLLKSTPCTGSLPCENESLLPACLGAVIDGGVAGSGRIVAWADEWITYDTVWLSRNSNCPDRWQPGIFWENVARWLSKCN